MLSERERETLCDIERRLRWHSPELVRLYNSMWPQPETNHPQRARTRALVAAAAVVGLMLRGPRMLDDAEADTRIAPPGTIAVDRARARDIAVLPTRQSRTTGRQTHWRAVSIESSCPQSPSNTDRDARAGSE